MRFVLAVAALLASACASADAGSSYIRSLLDYDIQAECRVGIMNMRAGIADGQIVPDRDIPDCVNRDSLALAVLDQRWGQVPTQKREQCLAAFGRSGGQSLALRYYTIAQCAGLSP